MSANIDQSARADLAWLLRRLAAGRISNRQFEAALPRSHDAAVHAVWALGIWPLYDDLLEHRMTGRWRLTRLKRHATARIVLFLQSGLPYRYPPERSWVAIPALLLSLITAGWYWRWRHARRWRAADVSVWPFFSKHDLESAAAGELARAR
jgi:hypothetical protein